MPGTVILLMSLIIATFIVLGILIKYYKCYWLISGYNLASAEKKRNIDIIGLSKFIGNLCFVIAGILLIGSVLKYFNIPMGLEIAFGSLILIIPFMVIRAQKFDKNTSRNKKVAVIAVVVFTLIIFTSVSALIIYGSSEPSIDVSSEYIEIDGMYGTKISMENVTEVTLNDSIAKVNRKVNGFNFGNTLKGSFNLDDIGIAKLYIYKGKPPYIYINSGEGIFIINYKDSEKTKQLFEEIERNWIK